MNKLEPTLFDQLDTVHDGPIKANELDFYTLLRRQAAEGRLFFNQRRAVIFDTEALGVLRQQLITTLGQELAMGVLTRFGYSHGANDATMLGESFEWDTETDWLTAGPTIHTLEGIVHVTPEKIEFDRETGHFHMHGIWLNSYEAEEHLKRYGPSEHPVCWTLTGYASGYTSSFFGRELLAIETECVGQGDDRCYWEIRPVEEWGPEAEPYLAALEQVNLSGELFKANQRLQKQTHQLTLLNEMSAEFNRATTVDAVLKVAALKTKQIINADPARVVLLAPQDNAFEVLALDDESGAIPPGTPVPVDDSTGMERAIKTGQVVVTHNIQSSPSPENQVLAKHGFHSAMVAPLMTGGKIIGTLNVAGKQPNAYDEHSQNLMFQIASLLGAAIENRRLLEQAQNPAANLEENTVFLDSIVENIPTMIFVKEAEDLRFVRWNKAGEDLVGFKQEDLMGKNDYDFFPKEEADFFTAKDREVLAGGKLVDIPEEPIQTAGGQVRWLHTRKVPVLGPDGQPKYLLGISEDITERKQAEEALKESQNLYKTSIDGLPQNVYRIDRAGRVTFGNKTYLETIGMTLEECLGKTAYDFFPKELADKYTADDNRVMETEEVLDVVEAHKAPVTGEMSYVRVVKTPIKDSLGNVTGLQATFWDVTRRMQTEQDLAKRATELETVTQVSTAISNIMDPAELLQTVVDLTQERFGLYHAHIYLLNASEQVLALAAGAGSIGRQMVAEGWNIPLDRGQSLVARTALTRQGIVVNDITREPDVFHNPLLPNTRSSLAVPIISGEKLLGVLNVQSEAANTFTDEDVWIQTTLAAQIAIALENARLFKEAQEAARLLGERVKELDCLNDIGREIEETPPVPRLLQWVTERIPAAMQYPELCLVAIEFAGQVYGVIEAIALPAQMTHGLYIEGRLEGRVYIAYTEKHDFLDEESALLGGAATRLSGYIENQRLLDRAQTRARREQILREVTDRIRGSVDIDTILRTAAQEVGRVLDRPSFVYLGESGNGDNAPASVGEQNSVEE